MADGIQAGALADLSVAELGRGFRSGAFTPVDALEASFARMDAFESSVNAFVYQDRVTSREMAEAAARRLATGVALGPLDGIPTSVKDLTPVAGWPNRRGSRALPADIPAPEDAPCVARLREAGAVFIGKTATPESGSRIVTRSDIHGVTRNPWDLSRTPGGSSGGAAAALSLGMGTLATGTDGAGSIRIPAAFCGLVGLKPSFGRVPSYPPSHFAPHSVTGPMARSFADLIQMSAVMSEPDPRDAFAWPLPFEVASCQASVAGMRVALSYDLGTGRAPTAAVRAALDTVAAALTAEGVEVVHEDPDWPVDPAEPFDVFWVTSYAGLLDLYSAEDAARMDPLLHKIASHGRAVDTLLFHRALNQRLQLTAAAHAFLTRYDAVLCPSVIGTAFDVDAEAPDGEAPDDWSWCPYAYVFNMTGQPAIAVPAGLAADCLPIGVQIAGRCGFEEQLLSLGLSVETLLDHHPKPDLLQNLYASLD